MQNTVIEGTVQEIMAHLAQLSPGERVRLVIGRPTHSIIAYRVQAKAASNGMTEKNHDDLLKSLKLR